MLRLQAELDAAMPDARHIPDLQTLQSLPFLAAVIKEGTSRLFLFFPFAVCADVHFVYLRVPHMSKV